MSTSTSSLFSRADCCCLLLLDTRDEVIVSTWPQSMLDCLISWVFHHLSRLWAAAAAAPPADLSMCRLPLRPLALTGRKQSRRVRDSRHPILVLIRCACATPRPVWHRSLSVNGQLTALRMYAATHRYRPQQHDSDSDSEHGLSASGSSSNLLNAAAKQSGPFSEAIDKAHLKPADARDLFSKRKLTSGNTGSAYEPCTRPLYRYVQY